MVVFRSLIVIRFVSFTRLYKIARVAEFFKRQGVIFNVTDDKWPENIRFITVKKKQSNEADKLSAKFPEPEALDKRIERGDDPRT